MQRLLSITLTAILGIMLLAAPVPEARAQDLTHPRDMDLPPSGFERPDPTNYELSLENGLTAYIARAGEVPLVHLSLFVGAGRVTDQNQGVAETLLHVLTRHGPEGSTTAQFAATLERMTAEYTVDMHEEWTEISLNVPTEDLDEALTLFSELIQRPAIDQNAVDATAASYSTSGGVDTNADGVLQSGSLPQTVARFYDVLYAEHPYGNDPTGEDFGELTAKHVADFHAMYFVPGNMTLAIAGDIDPDAIGSRIEALFGDMASRRIGKPERQPLVGNLEAAQHNFPADTLQTWLVFGHDLPIVPEEDEAALHVMNYILAGGHVWTRMTVETRNKYGYTNDASGFLEDRWYGPGSYTFRSYSRHDVIDEIYANMMAEVERIRSEPVNAEELFVARGALADGSFRIRYLDGYATARNFAMEKLRYGNHERSASYADRIRAVDEDDVLRAAKKYLRPGDMQVVLLGKPVPLID